MKNMKWDFWNHEAQFHLLQNVFLKSSSRIQEQYALFEGVYLDTVKLPQPPPAPPK